MPTKKMMGIETEYNIYSNAEHPTADEAINMMLEVLKKERMGLDRRSATPTRCFLANGGLLYKDMYAPEFCTPECPNPRDLVIFDKAGEIIVQELARKVSLLTNSNITIYKKCSDGFGNTSGCHENYSVDPALFKTLTAGQINNPIISMWITFLAIRQSLIGGGKIGYEDPDQPCPMQMSQRADFILKIRNNNTLENRPIIQTRDEPLADKDIVRRLHVICGDANLCEAAILMKGGLSSLMLMALEDGYFREKEMPILAGNIPNIFRIISRDINLDKIYETKKVSGSICKQETQMTLLQILEQYLIALKDYLELIHGQFEHQEDLESYRQTLEISFAVLSSLSNRDFDSLLGVSDWVTKLVLSNKLLKKKGLLLGNVNQNPQILSDLSSYLDMGYANMNRDISLHAKMTAKGLTKRIVGDEEIKEALVSPPTRGRAQQRVQVMRKLGSRIKNINWDKITFVHLNDDIGIDFKTPFGYNWQEFNDLINGIE